MPDIWTRIVVSKVSLGVCFIVKRGESWTAPPPLSSLSVKPCAHGYRVDINKLSVTHYLCLMSNWSKNVLKAGEGSHPSFLNKFILPCSVNSSVMLSSSNVTNPNKRLKSSVYACPISKYLNVRLVRMLKKNLVA